MYISEEDKKLLEKYDSEARMNDSNFQAQQINQAQQSLLLEGEEKSMIKEQLDLSEERRRISYLLRGYTEEVDIKTKKIVWIAPKDSDMIILSPYGCHLIENTIDFYINKNTLLSNYDDETIAFKMEDFATDLADTIFMEYEKVFRYPTFEECKKKLLERLKTKQDMKRFTRELMGLEIDNEGITDEVLKEIEGNVEREIQKIKEQIIKNKLKRFLILMREVQDSVHSTYLRAWKGQERTTLRQHIHITESNYPAQKLGKGGSKVNPFNWFR